MRKSVTLLLLLLLLFILMMSTYVSADTAEISSDPGLYCPASEEEINSIELPIGEPIYESLQPTSTYAIISVNVTSPCDKTFRNKFPTTYAAVANRAVESADDYLGSKFGIDYVSVAQPLWNYNGTSKDAGTILSNAISSHGITYNGSKKADLMVAFADISANGNIVGRANAIGGQYAIVFHTNDAGNAYNVQHETGHLYKLRHHDDPSAGMSFPSNPVCIMNQGLSSSNFGHLCTPHYNQWKSNKNYH